MPLERKEEEATVTHNERRLRRFFSQDETWRFQVLDAVTGQGLSQTAFALFHDDVQLYTARPEVEGWVSMPMPLPGTYQLEQTRIPPGYMSLSLRMVLTVGPDRQALVGEEPAEGLRLYNIPCRRRLILERWSGLSDREKPLLVLARDGRALDVAIPDATGIARLPMPKPGAYTLTEQEALGAQSKIRAAYTLVVGDQGNVCVQRVYGGGNRIEAWVR